MKHSGISKEPFFCNSKIQGTFSGIGTSPVILLGNQALASLSKFPESRKVEYFSDLVVSGWPMIFKDLLSICGQDFLSPYKTRRYLEGTEGTKRNPGKIISRFPCLDLFFWAEDLEGTILPDQKESLGCLHVSSIREAQWRHGDGGGKKHQPLDWMVVFFLFVFFFGGRGRIRDGNNFNELGPTGLLEVGD